MQLERLSSKLSLALAGISLGGGSTVGGIGTVMERSSSVSVVVEGLSSTAVDTFFRN